MCIAYSYNEQFNNLSLMGESSDTGVTRRYRFLNDADDSHVLSSLTTALIFSLSSEGILRIELPSFTNGTGFYTRDDYITTCGTLIA